MFPFRRNHKKKAFSRRLLAFLTFIKGDRRKSSGAGSRGEVHRQGGDEETFAKDIMKKDVAEKEILSLASNVARRLRQEDLAGKTITLKV